MTKYEQDTINKITELNEGILGSIARMFMTSKLKSKYKKAIEFITSKGGFVIRIGDRSMKKLKKTKNLIDLTDHPNQSDFLLSLYHNSKFLMTGISGPGFMTTLFKNPCLHVDVGQMYEVFGKRDDYCLPRMFFQNDAQYI